jgi:hypothetical protein
LEADNVLSRRVLCYSGPCDHLDRPSTYVVLLRPWPSEFIVEDIREYEDVVTELIVDRGEYICYRKIYSCAIPIIGKAYVPLVVPSLFHI